MHFLLREYPHHDLRETTLPSSLFRCARARPSSHGRYLLMRPLILGLQDAEPSGAAGGPAFLLKLTNDDELVFTFTFIIRQTQPADSTTTAGATDTQINNLTFVYASNAREVENLVTREFHADPNLHKNANVELVGSNYSTDGSSSVTFAWTWLWKPPKSVEDKGGGWRNCCSVCGLPMMNPMCSPAKTLLGKFLEYDHRAHRLHALASFSIFVASKSLPRCLYLVLAVSHYS